MFGWMIETPAADTGLPLWWDGIGWVPDPNLGIRFCRLVDAMRVIGALRLYATATEHGWSATP